MMQQYLGIKANHPNDILMFRLGDFFEIFFEDAITASKALDIALTGRDCGMEERAPMCGVPAHAVDGYITKLIEKGYRVALCDQVEDAKLAKGIVKREVVRVITPGTITDANFLEAGRHNYIAAVHKDRRVFGVAVADITTGLFMVTTIPATAFGGQAAEQKLLDEIARVNPVELLLPENFPLTRVLENVAGVKATPAPAWTFAADNAQTALTQHFGTMHLEGFGLSKGAPEIPAAGALLAYLAEMQKSTLSQITTIKCYSQQTHMVLDASSRRNLELTSQAKENTKRGSLLWVLDYTRTAMGARLLRNWVELPLMDKQAILSRQDSVEEWTQMPLERAEMREHLHSIHDMERTLARVSATYGTARDLANLRASLTFLPEIERLLKHVKATVNSEIARTYDDLSDIHGHIEAAILDQPAATVREGGMIRHGYNQELDQLLGVKANAKEIMAQMEAREKKATGIPSLKIRYNKVFGYYIEVTTTHLAKVPENYIRRQTLANCERYITEELKSLEETILGADEKIHSLEYEIFDSLRRATVEQMARIQFASQVIATLDALQSLAEAAERNQYVKPKVTTGTNINITGGRHPVIEKLLPKGSSTFVPNTTAMDADNRRLAIITGPNMAGKSTYMRQVALITLMAQIGSFVPAEAAEIGIIDRIFTRVGASDDLATGQSTFMVEMTEAANILNNATANSLVILDELGRGTSTYDGLAIAWAVLEHIAQVGAKTLFATHYHELTQLEGQIEGVANYCFTAQEKGTDIVFLRTLTEGAVGKSHGIHVAKLAGLPSEVITRANRLLGSLSAKQDGAINMVAPPPEAEPSPEDIAARKLMDAVGKIDVNNITPMKALAILEELKDIAEE